MLWVRLVFSASLLQNYFIKRSIPFAETPPPPRDSFHDNIWSTGQVGRSFFSIKLIIMQAPCGLHSPVSAGTHSWSAQFFSLLFPAPYFVKQDKHFVHSEYPSPSHESRDNRGFDNFPYSLFWAEPTPLMGLTPLSPPTGIISKSEEKEKNCQKKKEKSSIMHA